MVGRDDRPDGSDAELDALVRAAQEITTRRTFLRNAAIAAAWAAPIVETLVVVPEAEAQGHGHGHGHGMGGGTKAPHGHGHG